MTEDIPENPFEPSEAKAQTQESSDLILNEAQEKQLIDIYNLASDIPALKDITRAIFGKECDGRSKEGRAVKAALLKLNLRARPAQQYLNKVKELTPEHKLYIENNAGTMSALEMARTLFDNPKLTNLHAEVRSVNEHVKTLHPSATFADPNEVPDGQYEPPKTLDKVVRKVNQYIHDGLDKDKLTSTQKKNMHMLIGYLNTYILTHQINVYENQGDRRLFEDSFIRFTYDKPDLTQEEVNQYVILSHEIILASRVQTRLEQLKTLLDNAIDANNTAQVLTLNEAISEANDEHNECVKRQQNLYSALTLKRSQRIAKSIKETASILNLVQEWKREESRKQIIAIAQQDQKDISDTIKKLRDMDDVRARILGLTEEEALYG